MSAKPDRLSELELPSYDLQERKIEDYGFEDVFNAKYIWNNVGGGKKKYHNDASVDGNNDDDDERLHSSPVPTSIRQKVQDIDGVLDEIRLHSSPDPNDSMFRNGNGRLYNGYYDDDAMSDASKVTTSNLVKELNQVNESFLYVVGSIHDRFQMYDSDDDDDIVGYDRGASIAVAETAEHKAGLFAWGQNDSIHSQNNDGDLYGYFENSENGFALNPYHRNKRKFSLGLQGLLCDYRGRRRGKQSLPGRQSTLHSSRIRCSRFFACFVLLVIFLVVPGAILFRTSRNRYEEGNNNPPESIASAGNSSMPTKATVVPYFPSSSPSSENGTTNIELSPESSWTNTFVSDWTSNSTSSNSTDPEGALTSRADRPFSAVPLPGSTKDKVGTENTPAIAIDNVATNSDSRPPAVPTSSSTVLPVSGATSNIENKTPPAVSISPNSDGTAKPETTNATVAATAPERQPSLLNVTKGDDGDDFGTTTSERRPIPTTSTFARSPPISGHAREQQNQYVSTNHVDPASTKKGKKEKTHASSIQVRRRVLLASQDKEPLRKRSKNQTDIL